MALAFGKSIEFRATLANQIRASRGSISYIYIYIYIKCKHNLNKIAFEMEKKRKKRGKVKIRGIDERIFLLLEGEEEEKWRTFILRTVDQPF